ncbi:MAG: phosphate acyltransferase PlsX [Dehalococcoidia bacterium]|nr:phosphate acyltransferase PlsX [Dehalococcoidia bacterium]
MGKKKKEPKPKPTITVAVDAMGGDFAPQEIIKGALEASRDFVINIALLGKQEVIIEELALHKKLVKDSFFYIIDAPEIIEFGESPGKAMKEKPDSSIARGINLLQCGEVSGFVSAGHTGAVVWGSVFGLGLEDSIDRPAIGTLFPTPTGHTLLVDAGANTDCRPPFLVQFAYLGARYAANIMRVANPRIGLLSNGEEPSKGNLLVREAHKLLKATDLNFVGNVEGKDLPRGVADVVVTDGFTGNVVLKASEGFAEMLTLSIQHALNGRRGLKKATSIVRPFLEGIIKRIDYSERGGAPLLGVRGNVIIAHGRSNAKAIKSAIYLAVKAVDHREALPDQDQEDLYEDVGEEETDDSTEYELEISTTE